MTFSLAKIAGPAICLAAAQLECGSPSALPASPPQLTEVGNESERIPPTMAAADPRATREGLRSAFEEAAELQWETRDEVLDGSLHSVGGVVVRADGARPLLLSSNFESDHVYPATVRITALAQGRWLVIGSTSVWRRTRHEIALLLGRHRGRLVVTDRIDRRHIPTLNHPSLSFTSGVLSVPALHAGEVARSGSSIVRCLDDRVQCAGVEPGRYAVHGGRFVAE